MFVSLSDSVRIIPPSEVSGEAWLIEELFLKRRIAVSRDLVGLILQFRKRQDVESYLMDAPTNKVLGIKAAIEKLVYLGVLAEDSPDNTWPTPKRVFSEWTRLGWRSAAEYHVLTLDYPFLDYGPDGNARQVEGDRMAGRSEIERDDQRPKSQVRSPVMELPIPHARLAPFAIGKRTSSVPTELNLRSLSIIASLAVGATSQIPLRWEGEPLVRRTSPSGGSRHPTEVYIFSHNVSGLAAGWYEISTISPMIGFLSEPELNPRLEIATCFPALSNRANFQISAVLVLTSVFGRNMYRYREPRTFRSVHLDAGHIMATIELLTESMSLAHLSQYTVDEAQVERRIGTHFLEEGIMGAIAIGAKNGENGSGSQES